MEQTFDSLASLISFVFKQLQTSLLSVEKIHEYIIQNDFRVQIEKNGVIPSSNVSKRTLINELTRNDLFVSTNSNFWALRPNNPLFQCDAAIATSIEQMLTEHGPLTVQELVELTRQMGADEQLFNRVLSVHSDEFTIISSHQHVPTFFGGAQGQREENEGRIWFKNQPLPIRADFGDVEQAIDFAFTLFPKGASIEELRNFLCLATHNGIPITRICISHTFVQKPDKYVQIQRGKYAPADSPAAKEPPPDINTPQGRRRRSSLMKIEEDEKVFNPDDFFGPTFSFSPDI